MTPFFETHKQNFFPRLCHSCWAQTLLVTWRIRHYNRLTVSVLTCTQVEAVNHVRFLTAQIIEGNRFYGSSQLPRAWWHSLQRLSLRRAIQPTQNTKSRRVETEIAEGITSRQFAKEGVSMLNTFYWRVTNSTKSNSQSEFRFVFKLHHTYIVLNNLTADEIKTRPRLIYTFTMLQVGL